MMVQKLFRIESLEQRRLLTVSFEATSTPGFFVADIVSAEDGGSRPDNLILLGDSILFSTETDTADKEIWKTDGSDVAKVATIPEPIGLTGPTGNPDGVARGVALEEFVTHDDTTYFLQSFSYQPFGRNKNGFGLWTTDGTSDGTELLQQELINLSTDLEEVDFWDRNVWLDVGADVELVTCDVYSCFETVLDGNGSAIFSDFSGETETIGNVDLSQRYVAERSIGGGVEAWTELRSSAGGVLAKFGFDDDASDVSFLANVGDEVLFTVVHRFSSVSELWTSDGTQAGTTKLDDLQLARHTLVAATDTQVVMFGRIGGFGPHETAHQLVVVGLEDDSVVPVGSFSTNEYLANTPVSTSGNQTLFVTNNIDFGLVDNNFQFTGSSTLWRLDNQTLEVEALKRVNGYMHLAPEPVDGVLYLTGEDKLWKTDGTAEGTEVVGDAPGANSPLAVLGTDVYFAANRDGFGHELWMYKVDATLEGDINGNGSVDFADFLILSANFGRNTTEGTSDGDLDGDGAVMFDDFLVLSANFGRTSSR